MIFSPVSDQVPLHQPTASAFLLGFLKQNIMFRYRVRYGLKFMESIRVLLCAMPEDVERVLRIVTGLLDVVGGKACIEEGGGPS